jgi:predicted PurR-regulated permease PerM
MTESETPEARMLQPIRQATTLALVPLWIIAVYALAMMASAAATIALWIVCSFFLFALLDPLGERLKKKKWPTAITAIFLVLIATVAVSILVYVLGYLFSGVVVELNQSRKLFYQLFNSLNAKWNSWLSALPGIHPAVADPNNEVAKVELVQGSPFGGEFGATILHRLGSAVTVLTFALLVPILAFFFLAERDAFGKTLSRAFETPETGRQIWRVMVESIRAFFVGNLILGVVTYPLFVVLFYFFSVPSTWTVAALATVLNLVPFAGAVLAGFLPAVALYSHTQVLGPTIGLYSCCVAIHFIIADFVTPKLLGSTVNINATTSTIALVAWGELWGPVGLILAIPITSVIKIFFEHSGYHWMRWIAGLMSEDADTALRAPTLTRRRLGQDSIG